MNKKGITIDNRTIRVPGDKSLSHRFVLFSAIARGRSECTGFLEAEDPLHTMKAFSLLGVEFHRLGEGHYEAFSKGIEGLHSPQEELDFGNAGTGIRLTCGLLAGVPGMKAILTGDESLCKRPMDRILQPLKAMGAHVESLHHNGKAPLVVHGNQLQPFQYESPIASAQVKSCLLFAAMASNVPLVYKEPELSRNHTENMIRFLGGNLQYKSPIEFELNPPYLFPGLNFQIPGDISSAAFFIVLGILSNQGSKLIIENVGLNPSRLGIIEVLQKMGGKITIQNRREECGEEAGDIHVEPSVLSKIEIPKEWIPSIIDEIPILTISGLFTKGGFSIRGAEELRAKESDRIHSMIINLKKLNVPIEEYKDGYSFPEVDINLIPKNNISIETFMDHRIAMSFSILAKVIGADWNIEGKSWVETSFPNFYSLLESL